MKRRCRNDTIQTENPAHTDKRDSGSTTGRYIAGDSIMNGVFAALDYDKESLSINNS